MLVSTPWAKCGCTSLWLHAYLRVSTGVIVYSARSVGFSFHPQRERGGGRRSLSGLLALELQLYINTRLTDWDSFGQLEGAAVFKCVADKLKGFFSIILYQDVMCAIVWAGHPWWAVTVLQGSHVQLRSPVYIHLFIYIKNKLVILRYFSLLWPKFTVFEMCPLVWTLCTWLGTNTIYNQQPGLFMILE